MRDWAKASDTLYVVTGCIVEGSTQKVYDNVGKAVTVPVAYYKAVLRYKAGSTLGIGGYMGLGVYLENRNYGQTVFSTGDWAMSIDALEELTGEDFFVNLPAAIGAEAAARVEAENPVTVAWWK